MTMTFEDFYNKLSPFFTAEQIKKLNMWGLKSAPDVFDYDLPEDIASAGRWHVCSFLTYAEPEEITAICGATPEQLEKLYDQMQIEW